MKLRLTDGPTHTGAYISGEGVKFFFYSLTYFCFEKHITIELVKDRILRVRRGGRGSQGGFKLRIEKTLRGSFSSGWAKGAESCMFVFFFSSTQRFAGGRF